MIAFVGSVFSPAYFRARRDRLAVDPAQHCGFNVAVHGPGGSSWAFSEYRGDDVERTEDRLRLGRNEIVRTDDAVTITIDERTTPWGRPLRGRMVVRPSAWHSRRFALDTEGRHQWWPVAPRATAEVILERPALSFTGHGYHDSNGGREPLERTIAAWHWSRTTDATTTALCYDVTARDGTSRELSLLCSDDGKLVDDGRVGSTRSLGRTRWGLDRTTRLPTGASATLLRPLVDAPFYARSLLAVTRDEPRAIAVHEVVDLDRFMRRSTQWMLPFRTRGVGWW